MADVRVHDVQRLASGGREAHPVGVGLQVALALAPAELRPQGDVPKPRRALVLEPHQLRLLHEVGLLGLSCFAASNALAKLVDLTMRSTEVLRLKRAEEHLLDEGLGAPHLSGEGRHRPRRVLGHRGARVEVDAQEGDVLLGIWLDDALDRRDVERHVGAADGQHHAFVLHVHVYLVRRHLRRIRLGVGEALDLRSVQIVLFVAASALCQRPLPPLGQVLHVALEEVLLRLEPLLGICVGFVARRTIAEALGHGSSRAQGLRRHLLDNLVLGIFFLVLCLQVVADLAVFPGEPGQGLRWTVLYDLHRVCDQDGELVELPCRSPSGLGLRCAQRDVGEADRQVEDHAR
mmetsp:Transcript_14861/g.56319  ORF Transcript_14861/g.56319 Transcript_14861/m.56319 type:complete len:347 (+) Transcript_14861:1222-2262(+)